MSLVLELQREIEQWMNSRRNGNLSVLSRLSGVSYPTLRRIMQAEFSPNLETVMQVVSVVLDQKQATEFLCRHFPDFAPLFRRQDESGYQLVNVSGLAETFTREDFLIFNMASGHNGTTKQRIREKLGEAGERSLNRLLGSDLITVEGDAIRAKVGNMSLTSLEAVVHHMSLAIQSFDRERLNEGGSTYGLFSERLNAPGIEAASQALIECRKKLLEIFTNPDYLGDRLFYSVLASSYLD